MQPCQQEHHGWQQQIHELVNCQKKTGMRARCVLCCAIMHVFGYVSEFYDPRSTSEIDLKIPKQNLLIYAVLRSVFVFFKTVSFLHGICFLDARLCTRRVCFIHHR